MTQKQYDLLADLLDQAADAPLSTWAEKREALERGLGEQGVIALREILAWGWEDE